MALAAELLGDRWTLLVLREAMYGVSRFDDMIADLGLSRATLTERLGRLVEGGLLQRTAYQEPGARPRHAYTLTRSGADLALTMTALTQWGERYILRGEAPAEIFDQSTGAGLRAAFVDEQGAERADARPGLRLRRGGQAS